MNPEVRKLVEEGGFSTGLAFLAVMAPPNWSTWLSGDIDGAMATAAIASLAAVIRGLGKGIAKVARAIPWLKPNRKEVRNDQSS